MVHERCGEKAPNLWKMTRDDEEDGGFYNVSSDNKCYVCEYFTCCGRNFYLCCRCKVLPTEVCYSTQHHKSDTSLEIAAVGTGTADGARGSV
jgi:hypothetical protein